MARVDLPPYFFSDKGRFFLAVLISHPNWLAFPMGHKPFIVSFFSLSLLGRVFVGQKKSRSGYSFFPIVYSFFFQKGHFPSEDRVVAF